MVDLADAEDLVIVLDPESDEAGSAFSTSSTFGLWEEVSTVWTSNIMGLYIASVFITFPDL